MEAWVRLLIFVENGLEDKQSTHIWIRGPCLEAHSFWVVQKLIWRELRNLLTFYMKMDANNTGLTFKIFNNQYDSGIIQQKYMFDQSKQLLSSLQSMCPRWILTLFTCFSPNSFYNLHQIFKAFSDLKKVLNHSYQWVVSDNEKQYTAVTEHRY